MTDDLIDRWAHLLVDYCLRVEPSETIVISSELAARPLVEACYREVVLRGAHPLVRLELPGLAEFFIKHASDQQLAHLPPVALYEAETAAACIRIAAETDTRSMSKVDPARQAIVDRARDPVRRASRAGRWVLTQYPTTAYASDAGMTLPEYEAYVASAMFLDRADPVAAWQEPWSAAGGTGRRDEPREDDPDRGRRHRPHALGGGPHLDQFRRAPQHAVGRDLHRPDRRRAPKAGCGRASPSAEAAASWPTSHSISKPAASSRPAPRPAKTTCSPCSTSTPARADWASSAWA